MERIIRKMDKKNNKNTKGGNFMKKKTKKNKYDEEKHVKELKKAGVPSSTEAQRIFGYADAIPTL